MTFFKKIMFICPNFRMTFFLVIYSIGLNCNFPYFRKMCIFAPYFRKFLHFPIYSFSLRFFYFITFFASLYFDHDALMHYALHALDALHGLEDGEGCKRRPKKNGYT